MINPPNTLLWLLSVGLVCLGISFVFPEDGIVITKDWTLYYPQWDDAQRVDTVPLFTPLEVLVDAPVPQIDSTQYQDSVLAFQLADQRRKQQISWDAEAKIPLKRFIDNLLGGKKMRVLHYGDSQIEGDRMTSDFRNYLQTTYGGGGAGSFPVNPFVGRLSLKQTASKHWTRHVGFLGKDPSVVDNEYGYRGTFDTYASQPLDSVWLRWDVWGAGYSSQKKIHKMHLWLGKFKPQNPFVLSIYVNDTLFSRDTLVDIKGDIELTYLFPSVPKRISLICSGPSPAFYAASLEDYYGITVDNIAMRGSSGTHFTRRSTQQLREQLSGEDVGLVVLQYGGNTVPYLDNQKEIEDYGKGIGRQIKALKRTFPKADFLFIGPADMSKKIGGQMVTYPHLPYLRTRLKEVCYKNGVAFWDLYEVMGGKNSMPLWVASKPPLAGPDHVHFTPKGAVEIGKLWIAAFKSVVEQVEEQNKRQALEIYRLDSMANYSDSVRSHSEQQDSLLANLKKSKNQ